MGMLPKNYEPPTSDTGYMKWEQGENKFRILSNIIVGMEFWNTVDGKRTPVRFKPEAQIPVAELDDPDKGKHFWAMVVWNYKAERVQILEITQRSIQKELRTHENDEEWGSLDGYDIKVIRTGEGLETEYEVVFIPPKPLAKEIKEVYKDTNINLEALYEGENPFQTEEEEYDLDEIE